jgi:hypothetical protein
MQQAQMMPLFSPAQLANDAAQLCHRTIHIDHCKDSFVYEIK